MTRARGHVSPIYSGHCHYLGHPDCLGHATPDFTASGSRAATERALRDQGWHQTQRWGWVCPECWTLRRQAALIERAEDRYAMTCRTAIRRAIESGDHDIDPMDEPTAAARALLAGADAAVVTVPGAGPAEGWRPSLGGVPGVLCFRSAYRRGSEQVLTPIDPEHITPASIDGRDLVFKQDDGLKVAVWLAGFDDNQRIHLADSSGHLPDGVPVTWAR